MKCPEENCGRELTCSIHGRIKTNGNKSASVTGYKACPLCGGEVSKAFIGNNHTKKRSIEIKCKPCNLIMKQSALRFSHEWLDEKITEKWNKRTL